MASKRSQLNSRPAVLLTGFGPFPGMAGNASAQLVPALAAAAAQSFPAFYFEAEILPTKWAAAPQRLSDLTVKLNPILVLHFGVTREAAGFRVETRGRNACHLTHDAAGLKPRAHYVRLDGPDWHSATIPTGPIVARLTARGYPAALSTDAGGYLCNALLYHSLAEPSASYRCGFIHIPADLTDPPLAFDKALRGAVEIIGVCLSENPVSERS